MAEPKVRFKRDDGSEFPPLDKVLLGDITVPVSVRNGDNKSLPVYSVNNQRGFIPQSDQFEEREVASQDRSNYRVVSRNQFAYNPSRINVGSVAYLKDDLTVIVSPLYVVFACKDTIKNEYLDKYLRTNSFHNKRKRNTEGSVRDSLSYEGFASIDVMLPCIDEQQKIVDFLSSVDVVIYTSEQEVANLEAQKKAVMKKIFSQEVRFKKTDGTIFPEWEEKLLSDVSECLDNQRVPINATERAKIPGDIPYYGAGSVQGYINKFLFDEDLVLLLEDGDAFDDFKTKSISQFVTGKCWINNHAHVLRPLEDPFFLHCALSHKDIRAWTQLAGQSRKKLTQNNMLRITLKMPCLEEQRLIADFLSDFDEAISAAKKELELWKELKKGLLQQMFV